MNKEPEKDFIEEMIDRYSAEDPSFRDKYQAAVTKLFIVDLIEILGYRTTAYLAGLEYVKGLEDYVTVEEPQMPSKEMTAKLRAGYLATMTIVDRFDDVTARAWMFGENQILGTAPVYQLRNASTEEELEAVIAAAKSLII